MRKKLTRFLTTAIGCLGLMACASPTSPETAAAFRENFSFLADGVTRIEDTILRVGAPDRVHDGGHIYVYTPFRQRDTQVLLDFDDSGTLRRHVDFNDAAPMDLSFLETGKISRADVIMRLGMPRRGYAGESNLTYVLMLVKKGKNWLKYARKGRRHLLVLAFDAAGILRDRRIVDWEEIKQ